MYSTLSLKLNILKMMNSNIVHYKLIFNREWWVTAKISDKITDLLQWTFMNPDVLKT